MKQKRGKFMKFKYAVMIFIVVCFLISIASVSADENATADIISQETIFNDSEHVGDGDDSQSFEDLRGEIENASAGTVINLTTNYQLLNDTNPISIREDNITIDGGENICILDGNSSNISSVFNIEGKNVVLKNIMFINFKLDDSYKIIEWFGNNGTMQDCYFINNAVFRGTIIEWSGTGGIIRDCTFENNSALDGGVLHIYSRQTVVSSSLFINNRAFSKGGAIFLAGRDILLEKCNFVNCNAEQGGAVYIQSNNNFINNCTFLNCNSGNDGAALYVMGDNNKLNDSYFFNNSAINGGAVYLSGAENSINNSFFDHNLALRYGGAIFASYNDDLIIDHCEYINNNALYYGGAVYMEDAGAINNSGFLKNSALNGGAVFARGELNVENSFFNQNEADSAGALALRGFAQIIGSNFTNNRVGSSGGAIQTSKDLIINNSNFKNNTALDGTNNIVLIADSSVIADDNTTYDSPLALKVAVVTLIMEENIIYGDTLNVVARVTFMSKLMDNGTVSNTVGGTSYRSGLNDGYATFNIANLKAGSYRGSINFILDGYSNSTVEYFFTVAKLNAAITAETASFVINYAKSYSVTLKNAAGRGVGDKKVEFKLNGKVIGYVKTNSQGVATFKITSKMLKKAKAGTKKLTVTVADSSIVCPAKTVKVKINKEKTKLVAKKKTFKAKTKTKKFTVTLKNSKGKAIKSAKLTIKVKGKTYNAKTNKKGKATFKIKKLTKKGKYNAVIKFKTTKYYKATSKKVKITVKR